MQKFSARRHRRDQLEDFQFLAGIRKNAGNAFGAASVMKRRIPDELAILFQHVFQQGQRDPDNDGAATHRSQLNSPGFQLLSESEARVSGSDPFKAKKSVRHSPASDARKRT
ncbi:hypothetical protein [Rhizobium leguminosarum]|uniref:hypothetical protein n=1 Tax=Rhizobium leguminosarum TaxID=384 RepID=UPI001C98AAD9|nr:hypothetical protein [Rhizobium leguminosarum]MBY5728500.1 hypothetical protein [Rhizobium leguminosarum]